MEKTKEILNKLAAEASFSQSVCSSLSLRNAQDYVMRGMEIPEKMLTGRIIMKLPADERELLKQLTSDQAEPPTRRPERPVCPSRPSTFKMPFND